MNYQKKTILSTILQPEPLTADDLLFIKRAGLDVVLDLLNLLESSRAKIASADVPEEDLSQLTGTVDRIEAALVRLHKYEPLLFNNVKEAAGNYVEGLDDLVNHYKKLLNEAVKRGNLKKSEKLIKHFGKITLDAAYYKNTAEHLKNMVPQSPEEVIRNVSKAYAQAKNLSTPVKLPGDKAGAKDIWKKVLQWGGAGAGGLSAGWLAGSMASNRKNKNQAAIKGTAKGVAKGYAAASGLNSNADVLDAWQSYGEGLE